MGKLTLEIHHNQRGWLEAAELNFKSRELIELAYDLDYASEFEQRLDRYALSVCFPVVFEPYRGPLPGFIIDLIPQGEPLRRILARHGISQDTHFEEILTRVPLASPGNIRIREAWQDIEALRPGYQHEGFTRDEIIKYQSEFTEYMEKLGAPIGGTSGAGGGSPKFLLREDAHGRFHAEGMLDDSRTRRAWLIKFPYTDSHNSKLISAVEKAYYDILRELPLETGAAIEIFDDVLFIQRFDRERDAGGYLCYHGLESLYAAHNLILHGAPLLHEDNLLLIKRHSTAPESDLLEYLKRDILNQILANPDNHGRNTSLIKKDGTIRLSPIYDVTAMKFFKSEPIRRLTRWSAANPDLKAQIAWMMKHLGLSLPAIKESLREFREALATIESSLKIRGVPQEFIDNSAQDRNEALRSLHANTSR